MEAPTTTDFGFLAKLWLREPDEVLLAGARNIPELAAHVAPRLELAAAWTDLFLMNVYPYAGVYLDADAELAGDRAVELGQIYEREAYAPAELAEVAAPDHVGLVLGLIEHAPSQAERERLADLALDWAPILFLAVEREPHAHEFYRVLARLSCVGLLGLARPPRAAPAVAPAHDEDPLAELVDDEGEVRLRSIVRWLLSPARAGMYLSRSRLGTWSRRFGLAPPFGDRVQVAMGLFEGAGASGRVPELLELLAGEQRAWGQGVADLAQRFPGWSQHARAWQARIERGARTLAALREQASAGESARV